MFTLGNYVNALRSQTNSDYYCAEPEHASLDRLVLGTKHIVIPRCVINFALTCNASMIGSQSIP